MRKVVKLSNLSPEEAQIAPRSARQILTEPVPKYELPEKGMDPDLTCFPSKEVGQQSRLI